MKLTPSNIVSYVRTRGGDFCCIHGRQDCCNVHLERLPVSIYSSFAEAFEQVARINPVLDAFRQPYDMVLIFALEAIESDSEMKKTTKEN